AALKSESASIVAGKARPSSASKSRTSPARRRSSIGRKIAANASPIVSNVPLVPAIEPPWLLRTEGRLAWLVVLSVWKGKILPIRRIALNTDVPRFAGSVYLYQTVGGAKHHPQCFICLLPEFTSP